MSLIDHARRELDLAGLGDEDADYGGMLKDATLQLVEMFAAQGHSGASAVMVADLVQRLMRYDILTPLTGEDSEWTDVAEYGGDIQWQNNRLSHVFKDGGVDRAYDIDAIVLVDPSGCRWMGPRQYIEFPYMPNRKEYRIDSHGRSIGDHGYAKEGLCEDDGCACWTGGEKLILPGDPGWNDEAEAGRAAVES